MSVCVCVCPGFLGVFMCVCMSEVGVGTCVCVHKVYGCGSVREYPGMS